MIENAAQYKQVRDLVAELTRDVTALQERAEPEQFLTLANLRRRVAKYHRELADFEDARVLETKPQRTKPKD